MKKSQVEKVAALKFAVIYCCEKSEKKGKPGLTYEREARLRKGSADASDLRFNERYDE